MGILGDISPAERRDWFVWQDPPAAWLQQYGAMPGLQPIGDGTRITHVFLHRSHLPCVPADVSRNGTVPLPDHNPDLSILRPYQASVLPFILSRRSTLLAFQMRLGKTPTACHAHNPRDGMLVVVGPLISRDVWCDWIERVHGTRPAILSGRKNIELKSGHAAYFVHYDVLDAHTAFFVDQHIGTLIFDECHLLQSRQAQRTAAANVLAARASRILGLSGTPMWSRPISLWSVLHLIAPGAWGGRHAFAKRYANAMPGAHGWSYDGISHADELRDRLSEIVIRRTWQEVLQQLPPVVRVVEPVAVGDDDVAAVYMLAERARLAAGTKTFVGAISTLRQKLATLKVSAACDAAQDAFDNGHAKVVVWAWHTKVAERIAQHFKGRGMAVFRLASADAQKVRDEAIADFKRCNGHAVMVASIAVGGVAIDLSCADYAVFAEFDWTPANMYQAEMRTFHPSRPHTVVYLYLDVSIERALVDALSVREGFNQVLGLGENDVSKAVLESIAV